MLILSNLLALALVVADETKTTPHETPMIVTGGLPGKTDAVQEIWPLTLPEAIRIGLDNSEEIRVVPEISYAAYGIARVNSKTSIWKFKSEVMAHVRSVEQTYWALSHAQVALWSRETALRLGTEILKREQAELEVGKSNQADVAEAVQQVENFKLNLISASSDVMTTEKQLRNLLGLPPADARRIVPSTAPTEARLEPDWEVSVREMTGVQPDIAQQNTIVRLAELQLLQARNQLLPLMGPEALHEFAGLGDQLGEVAPEVAGLIRLDAARPYPAGMDPSQPREPEFIAAQVGLVRPPIGHWTTPLNVRPSQSRLLRERATQRQILHQATHSLARFFLEVDANYKQFRTAQNLRAASQQRLESQRAFYEEGRVTIDRLLDAVSQYANAIAQESLYKSSYNTSIAALEEAKGTLLVYDKIAMLDWPAAPKAEPALKQDAVVTATFNPSPSPATTPAAQPTAPMTYKVKASLWGMKFLEIEVEATPTPPGR